jgi:hypothetical protein
MQVFFSLCNRIQQFWELSSMSYLQKVLREAVAEQAQFDGKLNPRFSYWMVRTGGMLSYRVGYRF